MRTEVITRNYYTIEEIRELYPDRFKYLYDIWCQTIIQKITKDVFVNYSSPLKNLGILINSTNCSVANYFPTQYSNYFKGDWYNGRIKAFKKSNYNESFLAYYDALIINAPKKTQISFDNNHIKLVMIDGVTTVR